MWKIKVLEKDSVIFGTILSIILPLVLFAIVYFAKYDDIWRNPLFRESIPKIFSLCVFPNGLVFYNYIVKNKLRTMRGMLSGTIILALILGILFFIF
ncbi:MAG: hypothetical protein LBT50_01980 [Prevotellaceae bacterium]|jgi:hypothetical protein|nr:hypothetical protein [Prevotellaceae bacterium]